MNARWTALLLGVVCCAALTVRSTATDTPQAGPKKLPDAVVKILEGATELEIGALDPGDEKGDPKSLGKTVVKDAAKRAEILKALYKSVAEGEFPAKCFIPRHTLRATKDGTTVDMVICFQCSRIHMTVGKQAEPDIIPISEALLPVLNKILADAGIKVAN